MGQSGAPERDGVTRVTSPSTPPRMEVVMGRCFPLTGPGHHLTSPSYLTTATFKSVTKTEDNLNNNNNQRPNGNETLITQKPPQSSSRTSRAVQQNGNIPNTRVQQNESIPNMTEKQNGNIPNTRANLTEKQNGNIPSTRAQQNGSISNTPVQQNGSTPNKISSTSVQQNGSIPNTSPVSSKSVPDSSNRVKEGGITETTIAERNVIAVQPESKPKQPILRRAQTAVTPEPDVQNTNKPSSDSLFARIKAKVEQLTPGKDEVTGREAWDMTQKKKAFMREEFFKIPYEECNKEAAMSLGGRLNKSEPRLNTICKDRKKRNSVSYKRRVHFDLDEDKDLDDDRPSFSRRHSSMRLRNVAPPQKLVVSIYSIEDPAKRIQQVQLPDSYGHVMQANQETGPDNSKSGLVSRNRNYIRIKTSRPTDLDSLQNSTVLLTPETPTTDDHQNFTNDTGSPIQDDQQNDSSKSHSPSSTRRASTSTATGQSFPLKTNEESPAVETLQRRYSLPPPLQQMSVRPRQPSAHSAYDTHDTKNNITPSKQEQHTTNVSPNSCSTLVSNGPIPAPRFRTTPLRKSYSVQDDTHTSTSLSQSSRPDTLNLNTALQAPRYVSAACKESSLAQPFISTQQSQIKTKPGNISPAYNLRKQHTPTEHNSKYHTPILHSPTPVPSQKTTKEVELVSPLSPSSSTNAHMDTQSALSILANTPPQTPKSVHTPIASHQLPSTATSQKPTVPQKPTNLPPPKALSPQITRTQRTSTTYTPITPHTPLSISYTPTTPHTPTTSHKPITPNKPTTSYTPTATSTHSPINPSSPTTPNTTATPNIITTPTSVLSPPIPKPRKWISSSQQTATPTQSPVNHPKPATGSSNSSTHTSHSTTSTSKPVVTQNSLSETRTPTQSSQTSTPIFHTPQADTCQLQSTTPTSNPIIYTSKPVAHNPRAVTSSTQSAPHTPLYHYHTFSSPHLTHSSQLNQISYPNIIQSNGHIGPHRTPSTDPGQKGVHILNNKATHKNHNKENHRCRLESQKIDKTGKGNAINILMTKGESYSKHSIVVNSHIGSPSPSVTVRKIYVPVSAPSRCSPSPTPSCASSSCSFGSSGSSSGCFSGSPSPTPTPSPTRIRASGVPTDL